MKIFAEDALNDLGLVRAQQSVVDEDAGELVANRLVQKRSYDRGIDPAAQGRARLCCRRPARARVAQASSMNEPIVQSIAQWQMR